MDVVVLVAVLATIVIVTTAIATSAVTAVIISTIHAAVADDAVVGGEGGGSSSILSSPPPSVHLEPLASPSSLRTPRTHPFACRQPPTPRRSRRCRPPPSIACSLLSPQPLPHCRTTTSSVAISKVGGGAMDDGTAETASPSHSHHLDPPFVTRPPPTSHLMLIVASSPLLQ